MVSTSMVKMFVYVSFISTVKILRFQLELDEELLEMENYRAFLSMSNPRKNPNVNHHVKDQHLSNIPQKA